MRTARIGVLVFFLSLNSCTAQQSIAEFYEGLKATGATGSQSGAIVWFEKALDAANTVVAAAAAAELMNLYSAGAELSTATMALIRQKAAGPWEKAFDAMDNPVIDREKALALLLSGESRSLSEAAHYALRQWRSDDTTFFTETENALIDGRIAASRSRYNEALLFFRIALRDSPELFFQYPDLITDLGRTFQYTATGKEGVDLFLEWEETGGSLIPEDNENLVRFRLLFFAARIARQRGDSGNIELFEKALPFAREVSPEQSDACIWYILDSSFALGSDRTVHYLETYISQWHEDAYFSDVMDKLSRDFILKKQWENIEKVFALLKDREGVVTAHYAWILGRAFEEGYFSSNESVSAYMRVTYNASGNAGTGASATYYRSLSASILGGPFLALPDAAPQKTAPAKSAKNMTDTMQFLLGFFEHDAAIFAPRYIRAEENDLSPEELYLLAKALGEAGQYQESIRLVSLYIKRDDYQTAKQDLELLYPRPFKELVEHYAAETAIDPALLFALIRTESAFNSDAISRAGAIGLTQLMPATARETAARIHRRGGPDYTFGDNGENAAEPALNLYDPAVNIHIGAFYFAYLEERMEDTLLSLLAYNGGINRVRRWYTAANRALSGNVPNGTLPPDVFLETVEYPETRNYGRSVIGTAAMYKALY